MLHRQGARALFLGRPRRYDLRAARSTLARMADEEGGMSRLRTALADGLPASAVADRNDGQVLDALAALVASGRMVILGDRSPQRSSPELAEAAEPAPAQEQPAEEKSWIEISVLRSDTGAPLSGVPLLITPASGSESEHKTDDKGKIRLDGIAKGPCVVRSKLKAENLSDVLIFMGAGGPPAPPPEGEGGAGGEKKTAATSIVAVEKRKVKTGDTLDSLAKSVGSTWQKIAKLNFGTDDPKKINGFLRTAVGCTKKSSDGKNYVLDDSDSPGIILLPHEWKAESMDSGHAHSIEVVPAAGEQAWIFSL